MSKKQFEDIEQKIREAAENNQHEFQDTAWDKMNALLDKEGDDKKRGAFWWIPLLLLLLGGGAYFYFKNLSATKDDRSLAAKEESYNNTEEENKKQKTKEAEVTAAEQNNIAGTQAEKEKNSTGKNISAAEQHKQDNKNTSPRQQAKQNKALNPPTKNTFSKKGKLKVHTQADIATLGEDKDQKESTDDTPPVNEKKDIAGNTEINEPTKQSQQDNTAIKETATTKDSSTSVKKSEEKNTTETKQNKTANNNSKPSRFYFLAAVGAEAASTKILSFDNSKVAPAYGIGIGYKLTKKLSIQTGFYAGAKKYIAGHNDYHPKPGSYWDSYGVYIKKVDANCMVYEIPLTIRYSFLQKPKTGYFITSGVSTYIMKKEDYMYNYMRNYVPYSGRYVYTGNKHLFSVLTFSAGIDKRLSQKISLLAGPTFGIPVSGVGDGSVKLFTAGIMAGLKYQPSLKK